MLGSEGTEGTRSSRGSLGLPSGYLLAWPTHTYLAPSDESSCQRAVSYPAACEVDNLSP